MADSLNGRKKWDSNKIVNVILAIALVVIGGLTIWQTSHAQTRQEYQSEAAKRDAQIESVRSDIEELKINIATLTQKVDDLVTGVRK